MSLYQIIKFLYNNFITNITNFKILFYNIINFFFIDKINKMNILIYFIVLS